MANVAFRESGAGGPSSSFTLSAAQTGDLILVMYVGATTPTIPAGFTQIGTALTLTYVGVAAYRVRQSGDSLTYSGWTNGEYYNVIVLSGIGTDPGPVVASNFATYTASANWPLPSLTASGVAGDGAAYVLIGEGFSSFSQPTDYTERYDAGNSNANGTRLGLTASQSTSGTATVSPDDDGWILHVIARSSNSARKWLLGAH